MKIKELIVVEGKNDINKLSNIVDAEIIKTNGTHLSKEILEYIKVCSNTKGVIIFTDPDAPGESIRNKINENIKGCKNAFLPQKKAVGKRKVGIEHANEKDIIEALDNLVTYVNEVETISIREFNELGLNGLNNSKALRDIVSTYFKLGDCNAKQLYKRLNYCKISKNDIEEIL